MKRFSLLPLAASIAVLTCALLPFASVARQDDGGSTTPKPRLKAQSVLASKTAVFATITASDPAVKKATSATKLADVVKLLDTDGAIIGTVTQVYAPKANKVVMLNFAEDHWTAAKVAVKARNFARFPDLKTLVGKKVVVTGRVTDFDDKPQIEVSEPGQIKIVKE